MLLQLDSLFMNVSVGQLARDVYVGGILLSNASYHRISPSPNSRTQKVTSGPGTILIVGGELFNKGAQAMTYTVVSEIAERFPEKDIYVMSTRDFERPKDERERYKFEILPWSPDIRLSYLRGGKPLKHNIEYKSRTLDRINNAINSADCIIDINGYALSSQRGTRRSLLYLLNVMIARQRGIPFYIFPQSVGPFDYGFPQSTIMESLLKTYLPYPAWIFPREKSGIKTVSRYRNSNVRHELDIVLNHDYDLEHIFYDPPEIDVPTLPEHSVGIVPNIRVTERMSKRDFRTLYEDLIGALRDYECHPVIIQHSTEDELLCNMISEIAGNDATVITGDRQPFKLEEIIAQLDFLIGSRYHSVIHAYKKAVPAIVVGWAEKYQALLQEFDQSDSVSDVRNLGDSSSVVDKTRQMCDGHKEREILIRDHLWEIRSHSSVFETI